MQHQAWRDPYQLPDYLDDELEHQLHGFTTGVEHLADLMVSMTGPVEDPLIETSTHTHSAERAHVLRVLERTSPAANGYFDDALRILDGELEVNSPVEILAHLLRELESSIRGIWWDLLCFVDDDAESLRQSARQDSGNRDARHMEQIEHMGKYLRLTDKETAHWKRTAQKLPGLAHKGRIGPPKQLTEETHELAVSLLHLLGRAVQSSETTYGDALLRAADFLGKPPTQKNRKALTGRFPYNPPLRHWFLTQIDDPAWLVPLHKDGFLDVQEMFIANGSPVAPTSHGARTVARLAGEHHDIAALRDILHEFFKAHNPRAHTDAVQALLIHDSSLYMEFVPSISELVIHSSSHSDLTRLVGDRGILRFPSHVLRLALRAQREHETETFHQLVSATVHGMQQNSDKSVHAALIGIGDVPKREWKSLIKAVDKAMR